MKRDYTLAIIVGAVVLLLMTSPKKAYSWTLLVAEEWKLFGPIINEMATKYGVPKERVAAVILVESANDHLAVGSIGERGLMQLTQGALTDVNENYALTYSWSDMFGIRQNIETGTAYLALLYRWTGRTSWNAATQAYNVGIGNFLKNRNAGAEYLSKVLARESDVKTFLASQTESSLK